METKTDHIAVLRHLLVQQTRLLDALIHHLQGILSRQQDEKVLSVSLLMIQSLGVSIHSVLRLTTEKDMAVRDCFGIARSASELAVNICYISATGAEMAKRAERHAMQKTYRDLERAGEVGGTGFKLSAVPRTPLEELPEVASALAEFTRKNGKELADWTPDSISKRIDAVRRVHPSSGMSLSAAIISIYRHASEFLHGTYFSVLYFWTGVSGQKVTKESFFERWNGHFASVFGALFFSASAVIELFTEKYEAPEQLLQTQKSLSKGVLETLEMMNAPNTGPASVFVDVTDLKAGDDA